MRGRHWYSLCLGDKCAGYFMIPATNGCSPRWSQPPSSVLWGWDDLFVPSLSRERSIGCYGLRHSMSAGNSISAPSTATRRSPRFGRSSAGSANAQFATVPSFFARAIAGSSTFPVVPRFLQCAPSSASVVWPGAWRGPIGIKLGRIYPRSPSAKLDRYRLVPLSPTRAPGPLPFRGLQPPAGSPYLRGMLARLSDCRFSAGPIPSARSSPGAGSNPPGHVSPRAPLAAFRSLA
jgi:hypothetical protein